MELFRRSEHRALGLICNNPASTCWSLAKNRLPILAGPEYGNATKTYTNATAAAIILASEIVSLPWQREAERAAEVFPRTWILSSLCAASWKILRGSSVSK